MKIKTVISLGLLCCGYLLMASFVRAERLPVRAYTTADGLANDGVNNIVRDSRGFLWFCTGEGLSRFDGFGFKNYTQIEGLPHRNINDFLETKSGDFLVATGNGLAVFNPLGRAYRWDFLKLGLEQNSSEPPLFRTFYPPNPNNERKQNSFLSLTEDRNGRIFAGTAKGLFRVEKEADEWHFRKVESDQWADHTVFTALKFDTANYLWMVASSGIYRMSPGGGIENLHQDGGYSILIDKHGQIWVCSSGTGAGLRVFTISENGKEVRLAKSYHKSDGLPDDNPMPDITETADGRIFVLVNGHLCEFLPQAAESEPKFRIVEDGAFQAIAEDSGGNLWLGTNQEGAWKLALSGFIKFDRDAGDTLTEDINSLLTDRAGNILITSGKRKLTRIVNGRFETIELFGLKARSWGKSLLDFQAADGQWWMPTTEGLVIYPNTGNFADLAKTPPQKIYTKEDGLSGNEIFNLFQDALGNVWISNINAENTLQVWERKTGIIHHFKAKDGLPESNGVIAFNEDRDGNIWLGFYFGGIARYRNGKFQFFSTREGVPESGVNFIFSDKSGRLWIATASRGVFRVDNPTAEVPNFASVSTVSGLSSNQANCVTEDDFGHIYIGTGRGLNRLDPATGNIKTFTQADGLPGSVIQFCRREASGALWFVSRNSLVKFVPQVEAPLKSPPVFIGGISVNGIAQTVSELGAEKVENLDFSADQHQIRIDFFALGFNAGDRLRYQYKLNNQDWHEPEDLKSLNLNLAAGEYLVFVRAVNADGIPSDNPALVSFRIAYPFWQRWWFLMGVVFLVGGLVLSIERIRAARLRDLKNAFGKLSASENRFRQLIEQSPLGTVIFAPDGTIRSVNRAYEDFWGTSFEQIKYWDFLADEQLIKTGVVEKLRRVFLGETVTLPPSAYAPQNAGAGVMADKKADVRWIQSFAYPVKTDSGELLEVILVMEDVTDKIKADEIAQNTRRERLRELEQVRRRIAADLHDDIGSSLTQISIWSEVLQRNIGNQSGKLISEPLAFIGNSSRELIDAMSDIVWAINPQKDFFSELSGKMHRFAADVFTARNIEFSFNASHFKENIALGANLRREVFLIFKESINNIVKHSRSTMVEIELIIEKENEPPSLCLCLHDNGVGFNISKSDAGGHGLVSMKARADALGGTLEITSKTLVGTTIRLITPLSTNSSENAL